MREILISLKMNLLFVLITGIFFPLVIYGVAQIFFPYQANGSFIKNSAGITIGSELIGQNFYSEKYFHPRPSAAGSSYDGMSSGGTNLGPTSEKLYLGMKDNPLTTEVDESFKGVKQLADEYRRENGLEFNAELPVDAVTRSASGLDPEISPMNALLQSKRVAKARGLNVASLQKLIHDNITPRYLGIFGEPRLNVLKLNILLDNQTP